MIPAMTSAEEQQCFQRLAREQASYGAIVELGAWLGACTVAIATGIKESGVANVVHSYDRFKWNPRSHGQKAGFQVQNMFGAYRQNIEAVSSFVHPHKGEITDARWEGGPLSLLICDGPKRFSVVQHTLSEFGTWLRAGSVMAWQDFAFPPAYAIPLSLYRLREHCICREAVHECTVVFDITKPWTKDEVTLQRLQDGWSIPELSAVVDHWSKTLPPRSYAGVACGIAMFFSDLGHIETAKAILRGADQAPLQRIKQTHPRLRSRYEDLFRELG